MQLSRFDWYKKSSLNLRQYLAELEATLASGSLRNPKPTEHLITEIRRRLANLDRLIAEAEQEL